MNRPKKKKKIPLQSLLKPLSPFEQRMAKFTARHLVPRPGTPEAAVLQKFMDMDVEFQLKWKELCRRLPLLLNERLKNGSGLQISTLLRSYFFEYFNRYCNHGPEFFPASFNVMEAFMRFDDENRFFDLRKEVEHLLSIEDYFRWYESGDMLKEGRLLETIMDEGVVYSYDMIRNHNNIRILSESQQVLAGVSFVRHGHELSCLFLAGENPPLLSDDAVTENGTPTATKGREGIVADSSLTIKDRYLDVYPEFSKVVLLTRFDLECNKYDVRYVNLDCGQSFLVLTDDKSMMQDMSDETMIIYESNTLDSLKRYDSLFSSLASLIYLPVFFTIFAENVRVLDLSTELHGDKEDVRIKAVIQEVGADNCVFTRKIKCMSKVFASHENERNVIQPPEMAFKSEGYWKAIDPQAIGEGRDGEYMLGRTWVSRHESWSARSPESFTLAQSTRQPVGPDPGIIYVQRSPSHENNLYKIGLTRRSAEVRAGELSSVTGVPLPFAVLANWQVGDCAAVEQKIHQKLAAYRINPRREFFHGELAVLCRIINDTIESSATI